MSVTSSDLIIRLLLDLSFNADLGPPVTNSAAVALASVRPSAYEANMRLLFGGEESSGYPRHLTQ